MLGHKTLEIKKSKFNGEVLVKKTLGLGTYIQAGGITQSGKIIENIWKPALKKLKAKNVRNCLILGLGGGTVAKLVRWYWPDSEILGVEIDPLMVEFGNKYIDLEKYDIEVKIIDANKFRNKTKFDLILIDLYQGKKFPKEFEKVEFLKKIKSMLKKSGKIAINRLEESNDFEKKLRSVYSDVEIVKPLANTIYIC